MATAVTTAVAVVPAAAAHPARRWRGARWLDIAAQCGTTAVGPRTSTGCHNGVLGLLLASADAVFASFVTIDVDLDMTDAMAHAFAIAIATWVFLWLVRVACAQPAAPLRGIRARLAWWRRPWSSPR